MAQPHHAQEAGIDLVNDLQLPRQQLLKQLHPPGFQRLRQQRVVGVAEAGGGDRPGAVPVQPLLIDQQPHQFGHSDGWVGVVELDGELALEFAHWQPLVAQNPQHVLQGTGHEEDLLAQAQSFALIQFVVGVENFAQGFALHLGEHGPGVITGVEGSEVEGFRCHRRPQPQRVRCAHPVAGDRGVVGHTHHGVPADGDGIGPLGPDHLPGIAAR